ncbi:SLAM family member 5-like isoform X12 [Ctenopharyngodon idella]|uniref:SLAM family member 5-like isoform X12 n=1 Tax=Ctenopharyngodon idella TaxID=7959 RepID=UPI002231DC03|nr:SLAM family member 5-like isoform X12 [Ctenopharyngodon idella]
MPKNINDMDMFIFICLCLWSLNGVFVADAVKSESVTEGESVSLNSSVTQIQTHEEIEWKFGDFLIAKVKNNKESKFYDESAEGRFRDRLKLDQTGSLTIINSRTTDSGLYTVSSSSRDTINTINLTVYARLPVPVISSNSSSSSSSSNCSLLCSAVVNVGHVTLSWYNGDRSFSSISVSDLSISLSLPLEVEYQDRNTYSCVINNPIRNQTKHLNITELCHTCAAGESSLIIGLISAAAAGSLLIVAAVGIFCICRKTHQEVQSGEEITYADPTFYKRRAQKSRAQEEEDVVYAGVVMRH